jgi:cell division protein FtsI/penicillin-binding protein 2
MFQPSQYRRLVLISAMLVAGMAGLESRLIWLQVVRHDELRKKATAFTEVRRVLPPWRGEIRDRTGFVLAVSQPLVTVLANLAVCTNRPADVARLAASALGISEDATARALGVSTANRTSHPGLASAKSIVLKRHVALEQWEGVSNALAQARFGLAGRILGRSEAVLLRRLQTSALFTQEEQIRLYPYGESLAHLTGYVRDSRNPPWPKGVFGLEGALDPVLMGKPGWCISAQDATGRELAFRRRDYAPPTDGNHVVLTIDLNIQQMAERALATAARKHLPKSASVLIMRPRTGEILAWAVWPNLGTGSRAGTAQEDWRSHALSDKCEPGSTFKVFTLAAALNERLLTLDDWIYCGNGRLTTNRVTVHDHVPRGWLTVRQAIAKSSNVAFAKIALKLGAERLHRYILAFGFGSVTGVPLISETPGYVPSVQSCSNLAILLRMGFGQGLAVSQLQTLYAVGAICNDGRLMRPMLVRHVETADGRILQQLQPRVARSVLSPYVARQVRQALLGVVSSDGTAGQARLDSYTAGGKTGTAQKSDATGYLAERFYSSFVGFFPVDDPEICISVVLDEPQNGHLGGAVAAPVFRVLAEQVGAYLGIPPDKSDAIALRNRVAADHPTLITAIDPDSESADSLAAKPATLVRISRP